MRSVTVGSPRAAGLCAVVLLCVAGGLSDEVGRTAGSLSPTSAVMRRQEPVQERPRAHSASSRAALIDSAAGIADASSLSADEATGLTSTADPMTHAFSTKVFTNHVAHQMEEKLWTSTAMATRHYKGDCGNDGKTWKCNDGSCILLGNVCNGWSNCVDGSDEGQCGRTVAQRNGPLNNMGKYAEAQKCNHEIFPSTAKELLPGHHDVDNFRCYASGRCIPLALRCNSIKNCEDGSDEKGCPHPPVGNYAPGLLAITHGPGGLVFVMDEDGAMKVRTTTPRPTLAALPPTTSTAMMAAVATTVSVTTTTANNLTKLLDLYGVPTQIEGAEGKLTANSDEAGGLEFKKEKGPEIKSLVVPIFGMTHTLDKVEVLEDGERRVANAVQSIEEERQEGTFSASKCDVFTEGTSWKCADGWCIHKRGRCNNWVQCWDASDEAGCDHDTSGPPNGMGKYASEMSCYAPWFPQAARALAPGSSSSDKNAAFQVFRCKTASSQTIVASTCIPQALFCNGVYNCADGSDEVGCADPPTEYIEGGSKSPRVVRAIAT